MCVQSTTSLDLESLEVLRGRYTDVRAFMTLIRKSEDLGYDRGVVCGRRLGLVRVGQGVEDKQAQKQRGPSGSEQAGAVFESVYWWSTTVGAVLIKCFFFLFVFFLSSVGPSQSGSSRRTYLVK
ncbi:hypothetical protein BDN72DRAFT_614316 [Pluteus cervinus]|uniref:Uncharacterized protein n=1 Tax=Pluteus cervinus TaxID=181527 RepID=A0ACD3AUI8_9AGAR|nr:hypothetical protein BDN72DRAFT_614316 [Pluteus cervinus]